MSEDLFGFLGQQSLPEQEEYQQLLQQHGIPYEERVLPHIGTWLAPAQAVYYRNTEGRDRYVYILTSGGADYAGQTCYAFSQPVPDDQLAEVLERVRARGGGRR